MFDHSLCCVCGKRRQVGNHTRCSRIKQQRFREGNPVYMEQQDCRKGRDRERRSKPINEITVLKRPGAFSKLIQE